MLGLAPLNRNNIQRRNSNDAFDLYNIIDEFFNYDGFLSKPTRMGQFKVDLRDEKDHYLVEAELPGFKKEDITVDYEEGRLLISVRHDEEVNEERDNYLHKERKACSMQRIIYLKDIDAEAIDAKLEDGILKIAVPKLENTISKKQIEIK